MKWNGGTLNLSFYERATFYVVLVLCANILNNARGLESKIEGWKITDRSYTGYEIEYTLTPAKDTWDFAYHECNTQLLCYEETEIRNLANLLPKFEDKTIWLGSKCGGELTRCMTLNLDTLRVNKSGDCGQLWQFLCRRKIALPRKVWCPSVEKWGTIWPSIRGGKEARRACPGSSFESEKSTGNALWFCNPETGQWSPESPNVEDCVSDNIDWTAFHNKIWDPKVAVADNSKTLVQLAFKSQFPGDIVQTLMGMDKILAKTKSFDEAELNREFPVVCEDIIVSADVLLNKKDSWMQLHKSKRWNSIEALIDSVENTGLTLLKVNNQTSQIMRRKNIIMEIVKNDSSRLSFPDISCWNNTNNTFAQITIPPRLGETVEDNGVVFTYYDNLIDILPNEAQTFHQRTLNSAVVGAKLSETSSLDLSKGEVEILLKHVLSGATKPLCVYWETYWNTWNSQGCHVFESNSTHTLCVCDHLTNFAVLMDVSCTSCKIADGHRIALRVISVIGCSISSVFLFVTVAILCYFRTLKNVKNTIHKNLSVSLLLGDIILLIGMDRTETKIGCAIAAVLIQYFFLSAFCWMLMEAIHIQLLLTKVFQPKHSYRNRYYIFGYGVPLLIVIPSLALRYEDYGNKEYCWLTPNHGTIWSFIGPVAVVLFYNVVTLGMALWISHTCGQNKLDEQLESAKLWARRSAVLLPILGVTWSLGFFYLEESAVGWAYAFASLNSLQGLGIFIFHVALRPEVKAAVSRWWNVRRMSMASHKERLKSADSNS